MSWAVGYDDNWKRDIGYGVPAFCDHPKCNEEIDRGLSYVCGGGPYGENHRGRDGCGLFFCGKHMGLVHCFRCQAYKPPYKKIKPDHPNWIEHKLTDESWGRWRAANKREVKNIKALLAVKNG